MAFALRARFWSMVLAIGSFSCLAIGSAAAAVNNPTPTSGQTVTVDTSPPNPDTTGVHAVAGSTNVTVNILQGAQISVANNNAIVIGDQSQISNQGAITNTANLTFDGIDFGSNNTITNSGTITTSGFQSEGMFSTGSNNFVLNDTGGTITTNGGNSDGILTFGGGSGNTLTNKGLIRTFGFSYGLEADGNNNVLTSTGTIITSGSGGDGLSTTGNNNRLSNGGTINTSNVNGVAVEVFGNTSNLANSGIITTVGMNAFGLHAAGDGNVATNTSSGSIATSNTNSDGLRANGNDNQLVNAGAIATSGATANGLFANGSNNTLLNSGTINVSGSNAYGITSLGTPLGSITNSGTITATGSGGLAAFLGGTVTLTNTASGSMTSQQASGVIANGGGRISNDGTIAGQVTGITSTNGAAAITNSGTITGLTAPGLVLQGNFNNTLVNTGTIKGNGPLINGVPTAVQFGSGIATLIMQAGLINGGVMMGNLANAATLSTGSVINGYLNLGTSSDSTLTLDGSGTQLYSTAVTNATSFNGALIKNGTGTWILDESFTYFGATTINAGRLQLGNGGTTGSIVGNVVDNGVLVFKRSDVVTFPGVISGTGSITQAGIGTTILTADNTYSGGATIAGGRLQLGNGGTTGSIVGNVVDNGALVFERSDVITFPGVISGMGSVTQAGIGTTILTADNTYSGGTTIAGGRLQLGNGGTTGSIVGNVVDNGALVFERSGDKKTFNGLVSGTGNLVKLGNDTLVLTANNTYSGETTIESGTLVAGTPSSGQATSTALGIGNVFLQGGTLRTPSLDPLVIKIGGNYTQGPGGTLALGVAGINVKSYDHVQVGGNASLAGTLELSSLNNFRPAKGNAFVVLSTGGTRSGEYSTIEDSLNNNPNLQRIDVYAPNGVTLLYVAISSGSAPEPPPGGTPTPSPSPITTVIANPLPPANPNSAVFNSFLLRALDPTAEQLTSLFEIPFSEANSQRFNLDDRFAEIQRGSTGFVSPLPTVPTAGKETAFEKDGKTVSQPTVFQPGPQNRWGVWVNGWGDFVSIDGANFAKGYNFTTGAGSVGIDYRFTDSLAVGIFSSYTHTWTDLKPGDVDVNTGRGGFYATYWNKGFYINGAVYSGYNSYDTSRQQLTRGVANGTTSGYEFSTFFEAGHNFHFGDLSVGPLASLQYTNVHVDGYSERGSFLPLNIQSDSEESLRTDLGIQVSYTWQIGKVLVIPSGRVAWEHEYLYSALPITFSAVAFPGATSTAFGPNEGHDSFIIGAGAATYWTPTISTFIGYQGQLSRSNYEANGVTGSISFSF
jgi:autotransporter-associated beta strand protein